MKCWNDCSWKGLFFSLTFFVPVIPAFIGDPFDLLRSRRGHDRGHHFLPSLVDGRSGFARARDLNSLDVASVTCHVAAPFESTIARHQHLHFSLHNLKHHRKWVIESSKNKMCHWVIMTQNGFLSHHDPRRNLNSFNSFAPLFVNGLINYLISALLAKLGTSFNCGSTFCVFRLSNALSIENAFDA